VKNKAVVILFFILFPLIVGLACTCGLLPIGGEKEEVVEVTIPPVVVQEVEQPTEEVPTEEIAPTQPVQGMESTAGDLVLSKEIWNTTDEQAYAGFILTNQNQERTLKDVDYEISFLDAGGSEIANDWNSFPYLFPGQSLGVFYLYYLNEGDPTIANVDITYGYDSTSAPNEFTNPFTSEKIRFWEGDFWPIVTGMIDNQDEVSYTNVRSSILCYNAAGEIVGGGTSYTDFVPALDQMGFNAFVDTFDTVASTEVFPVFSYSSEEFEDTDAFWARTAILDDNFYISSSNLMFGGALITNNLADQTLTNTIMSVTVLDDLGYVTNFGTQFIDFLLPGETLGVSPYISSHPSEAKPSTYIVNLFPGEIEEDYEISSNVFRVNSATLGGDFNDQVLVNFTNTYTKQVSEVDVYVLLYDSDGNILGGGNTYSTEPTPAGGSTNVEVYAFFDKEYTVARVEAWVLPNFWTNFE